MSRTTTSDGDDAQREIPKQTIKMLREAGASRIFLDVIQIPAEEIPGAERNSARQEVLKYIGWDGPQFDTERYLNYGGGYFQALFDGDNPRGPADANNQHVLDYVIRPERGPTTGVQNL